MKRVSIIGAVMILAASATWVMAGPFSPGCGGIYGGRMGAQALSSLNLTADQAEKIRSLRESFMKEIRPIRLRMFNKRAEMRLLWMQTNPDPKKIKATQKEIGDIWGQIRDKITDFRLAIRKVLTPDQVSQLLARGLWRGKGPGCWRGSGGVQCWGRGGF